LWPREQAPPPLTEIRGWHEAYSFAYDPATEPYRVVHMPCYLDRTDDFNVLRVFMLGTQWGWRDVPVLGDSYRVDAGLVIIGGITHWVTRNIERVEEKRSGGGTCSHARTSGGLLACLRGHDSGSPARPCGRGGAC
jgi:hypothetical protein